MIKINNLNNIKVNYLISFILGIILTFSLPPYYYYFCSILSITCFLFIIDKLEENRRLFFAGWWFGFGYFTFSLYWISYSLFVDIKQLWVFFPFSLFGLPMVLAIYIGLSCLLFKNFKKLTSIYKSFSFAIIWTIFEILRGYLFTGFPWNLIGYNLLNFNYMSQFGSIVGIYGLSLLTIILSTMPYIIIKDFNNKKIIITAIPLVILIISAVNYYGFKRIESYNNIENDNPINIRIVQANINQLEKWSYNNRYKNLNKHLELSNSDKKFDYIIWSESSIPFHFDYPGITEKLESLLKISNSLVAGVTKLTYEPNLKVWNSLIVMTNDNTEFYYKNYLVPFGEYIPFKLRSFLPINKITSGSIDFSHGKEIKTISKDSFLPSICYEIIFSEYFNNSKKANWIINLSNDSWFGNSIGPLQHLHFARMRAIEQGLPVVRAANTGVSAVIDSVGNIKDSLNFNIEGVIDSQVPSKFPNRSIYSKFGIFILIIFIYFLSLPIIKNI